MDAAVLTELGTPSFGSFDEPTAGDGQVVVDVAIAGLNPVDLTMAAGRYPGHTPEFPSVPGREGIGSVGGRRVYFTTTRPFGSMAASTFVRSPPEWRRGWRRWLHLALATPARSFRLDGWRLWTARAS